MSGKEQLSLPCLGKHSSVSISQGAVNATETKGKMTVVCASEVMTSHTRATCIPKEICCWQAEGQTCR